MRYALIENNIVKNVIKLDDDSNYQVDNHLLLIKTNVAKIGDIYNPETETFKTVKELSPKYIQVYSTPLSKIVDQTLTSSTLEADDILQFYMLSDTYYHINISVGIKVSGLLPVYQWNFSGPSNPTSVLIKNEFIVLGATVLTISTQSDYATTHSTPSLSSSALILNIEALIQNGSNDGTFSLNFACQAGTSVTNMAGSYLRYTYGVEV